MKKHTLSQISICIFVCISVYTSCSRAPEKSTPTPYTETSNLPTPASTLPELISDLSSDKMGVRLVSINALEKYGDDAALAIPLLIENLRVNDFDVREAATIALGELGPEAQEAVPDLIMVLQNDSSIHVRNAAIKALGLIGDSMVVPTLAVILFEERTMRDPWKQTRCAEAIATLTGERFTDTGGPGYTLNTEGIPLLVIDARKWWQEEGQFEDWSTK